MTPTLKVIGIQVFDLAAGMAFYRHVGLEFVPHGDDHAECTLPSGVSVMLDTVDLVKSITPGWQPVIGSPPTMLAFQVDAPAQVDALFTTLLAAGARELRRPWDAPWKQRYASVVDPDGNGVDLFAALPATM